jgi:hypothetical protein
MCTISLHQALDDDDGDAGKIDAMFIFPSTIGQHCNSTLHRQCQRLCIDTG